jgi:hypothetical protein
MLLRSAFVPAIVFAACADPPPPPPAPPPIASIAPPPTASVAPTAAPSGTAAAAAPKKRPPPVACAPRPGYAAPSYVYARSERRGRHGSAELVGPRFATTDPDLASSLADVQARVDGWLESETKGVLTCKKGCGIRASCEVTRNDGEYLSLGCLHEFWFEEWRSGSDRTSFVFRRQGKRFVPITVQSLAREPQSSFLFRIMPTWDVDVDKPIADEQDLPPFYVALHDTQFELGTALAFDPFPRSFFPFANVAHHLTCDAMLDFPSGPPATPSAEAGALAMATHIVEEDDPLVAAYWFGSGSSVDYARFAALEPRHTAAAKLLNEAIDGYLAKVKERVKAEGWTSADATCRAYTSTNKLVSVLCYGGGATEKGDTRVARGSITIRLDDPPQRIEASELLAIKPNAPREIEKRCLGHLVHKPKHEGEETLKALPKLGRADLGSFALAQSGVMFGVEYDLAGKRRLMPCYVPNDVLGTSAELLARPRKR